MPEIPSGDDMATTSASCSCPVCGTPFARVRRQRYCSDTCRRTAWRRRHAAAQPAPAPMPAARSRRDNTFYECGECQTRYLGEQWCVECVRPCRRVGVGGLCPHCDEPVCYSGSVGGRRDPGRAGGDHYAGPLTATLATAQGEQFGEQLWAVSVSAINPNDPPGPTVLVRTDAAGATHGFAAALRQRGCGFSVGFAVDQPVQAAVLGVPAAGWTPAYDMGAAPLE